MRRLNALDWIALIILVIGGINWGLVGLFNYDVVAAIFGDATNIGARIVYILVGLSGIYVLIDAFTFEKAPATRARMSAQS